MTVEKNWPGEAMETFELLKMRICSVGNLHSIYWETWNNHSAYVHKLRLQSCILVLFVLRFLKYVIGDWRSSVRLNFSTPSGVS